MSRLTALLAAVLALPARADLPADGQWHALNLDPRPAIMCFVELDAAGVVLKTNNCTQTGFVEPYTVGSATVATPHPNWYSVRAFIYVMDKGLSPLSDYQWTRDTEVPYSGPPLAPFVEPEP